MGQEAVVEVGVEYFLLFVVPLEGFDRDVKTLELVVLVVDGLAIPRMMIFTSLFIG